MELLGGDPIERGVVEDDDGVGVEREALQRQQRVVRLHHHVAAVLLVGEDRVGLDELFGEAVVEALEEEGAHAGAGASGDGVAHEKSLQRLRAVSLAIDHLHDLLLNSLTD